jgi:hypothetical protein
MEVRTPSRLPVPGSKKLQSLGQAPNLTFHPEKARDSQKPKQTTIPIRNDSRRRSFLPQPSQSPVKRISSQSSKDGSVEHEGEQHSNEADSNSQSRPASRASSKDTSQAGSRSRRGSTGKISGGKSKLDDLKTSSRPRSVLITSGESKLTRAPSTRLKSGNVAQIGPERYGVAKQASSTVNTSHQSPGNGLRVPPPSSLNQLGRTASSVQRKQLEMKKPTFSTYQQQYTPKKPLAVAPKHGNSHDLFTSLPAEVSKMQMELLQLHAIHRSLPMARAKWTSDYENNLKVQFDELARRNGTVLVKLATMKARLNMKATQSMEHGDLEGMIQRFGTAAQRLEGLHHERGEYQTHVQRFTNWFEVAQSMFGSESGSASSHRFVSEIDQAWHVENKSLVRKLSALLSDLEIFISSSADPKMDICFLSVLSKSYQSLIQTSLDELKMMRNLVQETMQWEKARVSRLQGAVEVSGLIVEEEAGIWMRMP